ncbi:MAG: hypothetical protein JWP40_4038 [Blastococcus sp.]|jgi:membrane protein YdbS with pleckstrin-like domain|nr:hypothetical protein [Blastococcus sp.]
MSSPKRQTMLTAAVLLVAVGVLLILVSSIVDGQWPSGASALVLVIPALAALFLWLQERKRN